MSNKETSSFGELTANDLLSWAKLQAVGGSFFVNPSVTTMGIPDVPDKYFIGKLEIGKKTDCKITLTNNDMRTFINKSLFLSGETEQSWLGWKEIPTATMPQKYNIPLVDGITALQPCTYWKNQFGEVTVGGTVQGNISQGIVIGTLPEGFRPSQLVERPANIGTASTRYPGTVIILANGTIQLTTPAAQTTAVFEASFIAED